MIKSLLLNKAFVRNPYTEGLGTRLAETQNQQWSHVISKDLCTF